MSRRSRWLRKAGIAAAVPVLLVAVSSLALHLYGRVRFAAAVSELETAVGEKLILDLERLETQAPPEHLNAAVWLVDGARALGDRSEEENRWEREARYLPRDAWSPELEEGVRTLLTRHRDALESLHRAVALSQVDYEVPYGQIESPGFGNLLPLIRAGRYLSFEARLAFADGDLEGGILAARALARLASSLEDVPVPLYYLVGISCERSLLTVAHEVSESTEPWALTPALLDQLGAMLPADDRLVEAKRALAYEASWVSHVFYLGFEHQAAWPPRGSWAVRYQLGSLAAAEAVGRLRQAVDLIPNPYGDARTRFVVDGGCSGAYPYAARGVVDLLAAASLDPSFDGWRLPALLPGLVPALFDDTRPKAPDCRYGVNNIDFVHKAQRTASDRQLMRAALAMRQLGLTLGAYPGNRPDLVDLAKADAFAGRRITYRLESDGSLHLEVEGAQELARELFQRRERELGIFEVHLPPPTP